MAKKEMECHDYDSFATELHLNPCIWDPNHENYNLGEYRQLAFGNIEKALKLTCKLQTFSVLSLCG